MEYTIKHRPISLGDYSIFKVLGAQKISRLEPNLFWRFIDKKYFCRMSPVSKRAISLYVVARLLVGKSIVKNDDLIRVIDEIVGDNFISSTRHITEYFSRLIWRKRDSVRVKLNGESYTLKEVSRNICKNPELGTALIKQGFDMIPWCLKYGPPSAIEADIRDLLDWLKKNQLCSQSNDEK